MRRAILLAARGRPHPNPHVGAVVVRGRQVVGEGYHRRRGLAHAEAVALKEAGSLARGSTLFVTLEPCDHQGLTPPCTEAILAAGIRRVVIAARDRDPRVRGRGLRRLRRAGLEVVIGVLADEAAAVNEAYDHFQRTGRPLVELKLAMSLDGRLALRSGAARWITGEAARRQGHRLRAAADAVLVGAGTVRHDDPSLTVRAVRGRQPVRVVVSGRLDLPAGAKLFTDGAAATWVLTTAYGALLPRARLLVRRGAELVTVPGRRGGGRHRGEGGGGQELDLARALEALAERGIRRVLVEGGIGVATGLLAGRLVDRLHVHVAPLILGGEHRGWPEALGIRRLTDALRLSEISHRRLGGDIEIRGRLISQGASR
jgi:diaminohydroxyphosphoribosylaminopyrimidine deaminase/5-amino-6-(5-phosphoribosylamino)uracil reductase